MTVTIGRIYLRRKKYKYPNIIEPGTIIHAPFGRAKIVDWDTAIPEFAKKWENWKTKYYMESHEFYKFDVAYIYLADGTYNYCPLTFVRIA